MTKSSSVCQRIYCIHVYWLQYFSNIQYSRNLRLNFGPLPLCLTVCHHHFLYFWQRSYYIEYDMVIVNPKDKIRVKWKLNQAKYEFVHLRLSKTSFTLWKWCMGHLTYWCNSMHQTQIFISAKCQIQLKMWLVTYRD